jgi:hypothetical protein
MQMHAALKFDKIISLLSHAWGSKATPQNTSNGSLSEEFGLHCTEGQI